MTVTVLGVPDSAGAYCVGVEEAPTALREAGLLSTMAEVGHEVVDVGDLTRRVWRPDRSDPRVENLAVERDAAVELRDAAAPVLREGHRLLVLGGSCVIAVGMCAAMAASGRTPRLIYVDRHLDLNTPDSTREGSLSWMGLAHCLDLPGSRAELSRLDQHGPLLTRDHLVYLGVDETAATDWEVVQRRELQIPLVSQDALVTDPRTAAKRALAELGEGGFVVHVDVDVLDFLDAPLAENVNGRNTGPTIAQLGAALTTLWEHPDCLGVSVGQLVPAHATSAPESLERFVHMLSRLPIR